MHGSTFAGSHLVCKAALGVIKAIYAEKIMKNVKTQGPYLIEKLNALKSKYDIICGKCAALGLMIGVELTIDGTAIFKECFDKGLIINCTQGNVLRIMPALNVTRRQINKAIHTLDGSISSVKRPNGGRRRNWCHCERSEAIFYLEGQNMKRDFIKLSDYSSAEVLALDQFS